MSDQRFTPYVPADSTMREFTVRALILGLFMCVILGAANAYLGLKAGMTIAATYPAAVIGMAVLRMMKGSLLEENFARTVGSIGESVAAGAIFTIPAFVILKIWKFESGHLLQDYLTASALMMLGGVLGIMFVTVLRRVMVEDPGLPFPESVAASEIHKAGQRGAEAALQLFRAMGVGALIKLLDGLGIFRSSNDFPLAVGKVNESVVRLGLDKDAKTIAAGGVTTLSAPAATPAYIGVGYIIGPELGALNFAGGLLAWGLFVPLLVYFLGPSMIGQYTTNGVADWALLTTRLYQFVVKPIAVGGMLVGACYTLWKMRKNLILGISRGVADVRKSAAAAAATKRTERDLSFKVVLFGIALIFILMIALYAFFTKAIGAALLAAIVMLITGFFFAAVSGNLVGMIGSSNNPISGLTLATTVVAALTMVIVGAKGTQGVAAVLGVAAIGCVSAAVAGEMLQDLKVGHILGGT
ncbi:MAG: oligopeptide transporter, OPT family, partial [Thermoanaerobaculaceae bacterium]|nr:oligopeptide transporter, OPT family [Thermoanaerobaculaceae bacterium]